MLQIAPMVDWTHSPFRLMMRLLLPKAKLFTEMLSRRRLFDIQIAILNTIRLKILWFYNWEGSHAPDLLKAALKAQDMGYQEINLNLGCPSERVQSGQFGACLMTQKPLVMACLKQLKSHLDIPVTAKTRIGVDEHDSYLFFLILLMGLSNVGLTS